VAVDAGLAVPDQNLRQTAQALQAAGDPGQQIMRLTREDQDAGTGAREAQAGDDHPAAAHLPVADRDRLARLPEIELTDLARPIDRPLKRSGRWREQRPDLAQIVVNDRLGRAATQRLEQLADPDPGQLGIVPE
jgi:hypothetical protein